MQKLTNYKLKDNSEQWFLVDATNVRIGILSSKLAQLLMGKDMVDRVDYIAPNRKVVVINAAAVSVFHTRLIKKRYYRYSGWQGGLKSKSLGEILENRPDELLKLSVSRMLPKNKLRDVYLANMLVYKTAQHKHDAQQPKLITL